MKRKENICLNDDWLYLTKIQQIAYEIIQIWKENQYSIVSFLYDCDKWSFVGGLTILFWFFSYFYNFVYCLKDHILSGFCFDIKWSQRSIKIWERNINKNMKNN